MWLWMVGACQVDDSPTGDGPTHLDTVTHDTGTPVGGHSALHSAPLPHTGAITATADTAGGCVDRTPDPGITSCPPPGVELCGNGVDDDADGRTDCALEAGGAAFAHLLVADYGWLFSPGDVDGDGIRDLVGFNAIDSPVIRVAGTVVRPPFPAGVSQPSPWTTVKGSLPKGTEPLVEDLDGDGTVEMVMVGLDGGYSCDADIPFAVWTVPLDQPGPRDAAAAATGTAVVPPGWPAASPAAYVFALGDVNGNGWRDVAVETNTCTDWRWFLVDGQDLAGGTGPIDTLAFATVTTPPGVVISRGLELGDVDGDGRADVGLSVFDEGPTRPRVHVFTRSLAGAVDLASADQVLGTDAITTQSLAGVDWTGDGTPDLALWSQGTAARVLELPLCEPLVDVATAAWATGPTPGVMDADLAAGDLNADGVTDLAIGSFDDGVRVDHAVCPGTRPLPAEVATAKYGNHFAVLDADGDGADDLVVSDEQGMKVWRGGGR